MQPRNVYVVGQDGKKLAVFVGLLPVEVVGYESTGNDARLTSRRVGEMPAQAAEVSAQKERRRGGIVHPRSAILILRSA
jgi:hypothetical protein